MLTANPAQDHTMKVVGLDHLVLTVASIPATVAFYERVLGMQAETFGAGRTALRFGPHKINLHQADNTFDPKAEHPTRGSGDLCFLVDTLEGIEPHLAACGVAVLVARSTRTGARGPITSVYVRDPDQNLIELSVYQDGTLPAA
jgi:catechol 2,3-dioxygenase-like lactoylglutathione lyase family enzyme